MRPHLSLMMLGALALGATGCSTSASTPPSSSSNAPPFSVDKPATTSPEDGTTVAATAATATVLAETVAPITAPSATSSAATEPATALATTTTAAPVTTIEASTTAVATTAGAAKQDAITLLRTQPGSSPSAKGVVSATALSGAKVTIKVERGGCTLQGTSVESNVTAIAYPSYTCRIRASVAPPTGWLAAPDQGTDVTWVARITRGVWTDAPKAKVVGNTFNATITVNEDRTIELVYNDVCSGDTSLSSTTTLTVTVLRHGTTCTIRGTPVQYDVDAFALADTLRVAT